MPPSLKHDCDLCGPTPSTLRPPGKEHFTHASVLSLRGMSIIGISAPRAAGWQTPGLLWANALQPFGRFTFLPDTNLPPPPWRIPLPPQPWASCSPDMGPQSSGTCLLPLAALQRGAEPPMEQAQSVLRQAWPLHPDRGHFPAPRHRGGPHSTSLLCLRHCVLLRHRHPHPAMPPTRSPVASLRPAAHPNTPSRAHLTAPLPFTHSCPR